MKKRYIILILVLLLFTASGCSGAEKAAAKVPSSSRDIFAMDTYMTITCYGSDCEEAVITAEAVIRRLDELFSVGNRSSEVSRLNAGAELKLSSDTASVIESSLELCQDTNGCFDISVYPLMLLWGFPSQKYRVPGYPEIQKTLTKVGSNRLTYRPAAQTMQLSEGQGIDLGGIAKGYASDKLMEVFDQFELTSAIVSLGGNVQCYHAKPDGSLWRCGIRNPFDPDNVSDLIGVVSVEDKAVITSGAYERYFTGEDGKIYHHILDPRTGYPVTNGVSSVTIVSSSGTLADGLSTACFVMGLEGTAEYWRKNNDRFDFILVTDNGEVYISEPLKDSFTTDALLKVIPLEP